MKQTTGWALVLMSMAVASSAVAQEAGPAKVGGRGDGRSLGNGVVEARWSTAGKRVSGLTVVDGLHHTTLALPQPFALLMKSGEILDMSNLVEVGEPRFVALTPEAGASRFAERLPGESFEVEMADAAGDLHVTWRLVLRDGSRYLRQSVTMTAVGKDVGIGRVRMLDVQLPGAQVMGAVKGSPIVAGGFFLGLKTLFPTARCATGRPWLRSTASCR